MTKLPGEAVYAVRRLPTGTQDDAGVSSRGLRRKRRRSRMKSRQSKEADAEIARGEGLSGEELKAL